MDEDPGLPHAAAWRRDMDPAGALPEPPTACGRDMTDGRSRAAGQHRGPATALEGQLRAANGEDFVELAEQETAAGRVTDLPLAPPEGLQIGRGQDPVIARGSRGGRQPWAVRTTIIRS